MGPPVLIGAKPSFRFRTALASQSLPSLTESLRHGVAGGPVFRSGCLHVKAYFTVIGSIGSPNCFQGESPLE